MKPSPTAAICLIGDELLSGRTRDINTQTIARYLAPFGIPVKEVRIVPDEQDRIVDAVNTLRAAYNYVFTTGGIGPTHDDITADAIAAAFGVGIGEHPEAAALLAARYEEMGTEFTPARRRMAREQRQRKSIASAAMTAATAVSRARLFRVLLSAVPAYAKAIWPKHWPRFRSNIRTSVSDLIHGFKPCRITVWR